RGRRSPLPSSWSGLPNPRRRELRGSRERPTAPSERFPRKQPVGAEQAVQETDSPRKGSHLRIESGREKAGELAVSHLPKALRLPAAADEPARVAQEPPPPANLAAEPAAARRERQHRQLSEHQ